MDNGPELIAQVLVDWCEQNGVAPRYVQPGERIRTPSSERYNRSFREEVLDAYVFEDLRQVREISTE